MEDMIRVIGIYDKDVTGKTAPKDMSGIADSLEERVSLCGVLLIPTIFGEERFTGWKLDHGICLPEDEYVKFLAKVAGVLSENPYAITDLERQLDSAVELFLAFSQQVFCSRNTDNATVRQLVSQYANIERLTWGAVTITEYVVLEYMEWLDTATGNRLTPIDLACHFLNTLVPIEPTFFTRLWLHRIVQNRSDRIRGKNTYLDEVDFQCSASHDWDERSWHSETSRARMKLTQSIGALLKHIASSNHNAFLGLVAAIQALQRIKENKNQYHFDCRHSFSESFWAIKAQDADTRYINSLEGMDVEALLEYCLW